MLKLFCARSARYARPQVAIIRRVRCAHGKAPRILCRYHSPPPSQTAAIRALHGDGMSNMASRDMFDQSVLHRVVVHVIDVPFQIGVIANLMLPIAPLLEPDLAARFHRRCNRR